MRVSSLCNHIGKNRFSTKSNTSEIINLKRHIRKTQSLEVFRSQFNSTIRSSVSISISDIDCLVRDYQVRPSILSAGFKCLGFSTGVICNSVPSFAQNYIIQGVNHAIQDHLNDSLRDLQIDSNDTIETSTSSSSDSYNNASINYTSTTQDPNKSYQQLKEDFRETLKFHRDHNSPTNENSKSEGTSSTSSSSTNIVRLTLNNLFELTKKF